MHKNFTKSTGNRRNRGGRSGNIKKFESVGSQAQEIVDNENEVAYLSNEVRSFIGSRDKLPSSPTLVTDFGVVLFVDISGFTALGKKMHLANLVLTYFCLGRKLREQHEEQIATEMLAQQIMSALKKLTRVCLKWKGDVAKFAGDALLCVWKQGRENRTAVNTLADMSPYHRTVELERSLKYARSAALEMMKEIGLYCKGIDLHGGIGVGNLFQFHLVQKQRKDAQIQSRWHLVSGEAAVEAAALLDRSEKGSILYKTYEKAYPDRAMIRSITKYTDSKANLEKRYFCQRAGLQPNKSLKDWATSLERNTVVSYIPLLLQDKIKGGGILGGEMVNVATMFVALDSLTLTPEELSTCNVRSEKLRSLNKTFFNLVRIVRNAGGEIRDLLFDDKGCMFIAVFGAHVITENPEFKCVFSANKILAVAKNARIGISAGSCFTGMCGTEARHDFVVMGHEVNQAARYCGGARPSQLLVSPSVEQKTNLFVNYTPHRFERQKQVKVLDKEGNLVRTEVKNQVFHCFIAGKTIKRDVAFRAGYQGLLSSNSSTEDGIPEDRFVGRIVELERIISFLEATDSSVMQSATLEDDNSSLINSSIAGNTLGSSTSKPDRFGTLGGVISLKGDHGIGKSALIRKVKDLCHDRIDIAFCAAFEEESMTSLFVVKQLIYNLLDCSEAEENAIDKAKLRSKCQALGVTVSNVVLRKLYGNSAISTSPSHKKRASKPRVIREGGYKSRFPSLVTSKRSNRKSKGRMLREGPPDSNASGSVVTENPRASISRREKSTTKLLSDVSTSRLLINASPSNSNSKTELIRSAKPSSRKSYATVGTELEDTKRYSRKHMQLDRGLGSRANSIRRLSSRIGIGGDPRSRSMSMTESEHQEAEYAVHPLNERERLELDRFLCDLLKASLQKSRTSSLLIVVEDLHWIDLNSLEVIYGLFEKPMTGVTFLLSHRSRDFVVGNQQDWLDDFEEDLKRLAQDSDITAGNETRVLMIHLEPMSEDDCFQLAAESLLRSKIFAGKMCEFQSKKRLFARPLAHLLWHKTNGKPNYLMLLVKYYLDNDFLKWSIEDQKFSFVSTKVSEKAMKIFPKSIVEIAGHRMNGLDGMLKRVLKAAACIGKTFSVEQLVSVLAKDGAPFTQSNLTQNLQVLAQLGFIQKMRSRRFSVLSRRNPRPVPNSAPQKSNLKSQMQRTGSDPVNMWQFTWEVYYESILSLIPRERKEQVQKYLTDQDELRRSQEAESVKDKVKIQSGGSSLNLSGLKVFTRLLRPKGGALSAP